MQKITYKAEGIDLHHFLILPPGDTFSSSKWS